MQISSVSTYSFRANNQPQSSQQDKNPISKTGEKAKLAKATFVAGLGVGTKLLFELVDDFDLVGEKISKKQMILSTNSTKTQLLKRKCGFLSELGLV